MWSSPHGENKYLCNSYFGVIEITVWNNEVSQFLIPLIPEISRSI